MLKYTLNNTINILSGQLHFYTEGLWLAELYLNTTDALDKDITMTWIDNTVFKGVIHNSTIIGGKTKVTILGGSGKMNETISQKQYQSVTLGTVLQDIASATEYTLSTTIEPQFLNITLPAWNISTGTASEVLEMLLAPFKGIWQVLPDGTLWVGEKVYKETSITVTALERNTQEPSWTVFNDDALLLPPFSIDGNNINEVVYNLRGSRSTAKLLFRSAKDNIYDIASQSMMNAYNTIYRCRVVAQNSDGSVEVQMDPVNEIFKNGLSKVVICPPAPNMKVSPAIGTHCVVAFLNGDPRYPRVIGWDEYIQPTKLEISATAGKPAARKDDTVTPTSPMGTWMSQVATALNTIAPGSVAPPAPPSFAIIGTGSPDVLIG